MRILVHDFGAYPFTVQLARELAARGHVVRYVFLAEDDSIQGDVGMRRDDPRTFSSVGIADLSSGHRRSFAHRFIHDVKYSTLLAAEARAFQPELVLSADCPLVSQAVLQRLSKRSGARFAFWLQDLIGVALQAVIARRSPLIARLVSKPFRALEANILRSSDEVIAISPAFVDFVERLGNRSGNVHLLPNWAPLAPSKMQESNEDRRHWGAHLGSPEGPRLLYSGTLGLKHDPSLLADIAAHIESAGGHVVVVSEGSGRELLERLKIERRISNLYLLDFEPIEHVPSMLRSADVLVAILNADASAFSVPSKVLSYLSAGRPVLSVMPKENYASQIVKEAEAGFTVEAADTDEAFRLLDRLVEDEDLRDRMGYNARAFAEREFSIELIADRVERACAIPRVVDVTETSTESEHFEPSPSASRDTAIQSSINRTLRSEK